MAASIEGHETFTRTATVSFDLSLVVPADGLGRLPETRLEVPITTAVIYGWYDIELGSNSDMVGDRLVSIAELMS